MVVLLCSMCNTELEVENLDDITECPNCGSEVRKEVCPIVREDDEAMEAVFGTDTIEPITCAGCGEPIDIDSQCYAVQSGYLDYSMEFVRTDLQSQLFHIGKCMNSER